VLLRASTARSQKGIVKLPNATTRCCGGSAFAPTSCCGLADQLDKALRCAVCIAAGQHLTRAQIGDADAVLELFWRPCRQLGEVGSYRLVRELEHNFPQERNGPRSCAGLYAGRPLCEGAGRQSLGRSGGTLLNVMHLRGAPGATRIRPVVGRVLGSGIGSKRPTPQVGGAQVLEYELAAQAHSCQDDREAR
jgi:hypothetical protein